MYLNVVIRFASDELSAGKTCSSRRYPGTRSSVGIVDTFSDPQNLYLMLEVMSHGNFSFLKSDGLDLTQKASHCMFSTTCNILVRSRVRPKHGLVVTRSQARQYTRRGHDGYLCLTDFRSSGDGMTRAGVWQFIGTSFTGVRNSSKIFLMSVPPVDWWASGVILYEMLTNNGKTGLPSNPSVNRILIAVLIVPFYPNEPFKGSTVKLYFQTSLSLNYCWPDFRWEQPQTFHFPTSGAFRPEKRLGFHGAR